MNMLYKPNLACNFQFLTLEYNFILRNLQVYTNFSQNTAINNTRKQVHKYMVWQKPHKQPLNND